MTEAEISNTIAEKHNKVYRDKKAYGIADVPIERAVKICLTEKELQAYLNIYVNLFPDNFRAAIINGDLIIREIIAFLKAYPYHIKNIPLYLYIYNSKELKDLILNNPGLFKLSMLPTFMAEDKEFQNIIKESNREIKKETQNNNMDELDYSDLAKKYYKSHMSINVFCAKHHIANEFEFRKYIKELEDEKPTTEAEKERIKKELAIIGERIITGELSLEDYLKYYYHPKHTIKLFQAALENKIDEFNSVLAIQLYNYIMKKDRNVDAEKITTLFGKRFDYAGSVNTSEKDASEAGMELKRFITTNTNKAGSDILLLFKSYSTQFRNKSLEGTNYYNGVAYEINDEVIERILKYLAEHEIFISQKTVNYYVKPIVTGEIQLEEKKDIVKK